jgi:hypothetical protein
MMGDEKLLRRRTGQGWHFTRLKVATEEKSDANGYRPASYWGTKC